MTTRTLLFDSPFLLGFEHTRALIERTAQAGTEGYPPYNVEQLDDARLRITLAVAGFSPAQLQVTAEGRQLLVAGHREAAKSGDAASAEPAGGEAKGRSAAYLHRGIAARGFQRAFVLADGMEVQAATLEHGLLHIDVVRPEPERRVVSIPIRTVG